MTTFKVCLFCILRIKVPAVKVRHKFGKNCAIVKYFGTHVKNCTIDKYFGIQLSNCNMKNVFTSKKCIFLCRCPNSFNSCEMSLFSKKWHEIWSFFWQGWSCGFLYKSVLRQPGFRVLYILIFLKVALHQKHFSFGSFLDQKSDQWCTLRVRAPRFDITTLNIVSFILLKNLLVAR